MSIIRKTWNIIKALGRVGIRVIIETFHRLTINLFDTLFGFLNWPEKKLRIRVLILRDEQGNPVCSSADTEAAIDYAKRIFKKNFNVKLLSHQKVSFVEVLQTRPSIDVLHTKGGPGALREEFTITGSFFANHLAGVFYPVTAFVVIHIKGATGCSLGPISDYVTLDPFGAKQVSVLAHELAHACGLWHVQDKTNLLYPTSKRSDAVKWWQKNLFRSSRHVTYW